MIFSNITTSICAHCGRPVLNPILHGGNAYHYECTQSPYAKEIKLRMLPNSESVGTQHKPIKTDEQDFLG